LPAVKPQSPSATDSAPVAHPGGWRFWIDRGGTFTDLVAVSPEGEWHMDKLLSVNPAQYADAASEGIARMLRRLGRPGDVVEEIRLGTTVATNALLEYKGARVVLLVTAGFADLPVIRAQNRPELFARALRRPAPLFTSVIEVRERLGPNGEVLVPLAPDALACLTGKLRAARAAGAEAVACCFLHAWAHPAHELLAAEAARAAGFTAVFCSHQVSPLPRWVPRADTTLADAYLTPVLQRYLAGFLERVAPFQPREVAFMQSHGGLTAASTFRGVDALLSGPAGGLVGMRGAGMAAGESRLVGFDMGGTSTDVALVVDDLPRRPVNTLAGLTLQVPMLDIHTVAAGGGSLLRHLDGRLTVGPDSAGADPGPRCYRRQGPLAVTDANVLLGRLVPQRFPAVFGPTADQPLDVAGVVAAFAELATTLLGRIPQPGEPERLAEDFLEVAAVNMANAVRHVAVRAGHDPAAFTLVCFGGAGGQHACQVAGLLGIRRVLVHPFASVLSAVGIGLAPRRAVRRRGDGRTLACAWQAREGDSLTDAFAALESAVGPMTHWTRTLYLRVAGTDTALPVSWSAQDDCHTRIAAFAAAYRQRYGFEPEAADLDPAALVVDALEVEGTADDQRALSAAPRLPRAPYPTGTTRAWFAGAWLEVPLVDRAALRADEQLSGPALITDEGATTVVPAGWRVRVLAQGELLLAADDDSTAAAPSASGHCQSAAAVESLEAPTPARLEIFNGLFMQVAEQMGLVLCEAARSVNVKERLDFSCAVFGADGSLVANAPHMPVLLGSMGASVRAVRQRLQDRGERAREGDAWLVNVPWAGGTHLPDVTAVSPVFLAGEAAARFWVASRAHHADLGGITPGSMPPDSTRIAEEGVCFDAFRVMDGGRFLGVELQAKLLDGPWPARNPEQNLADVRAQLAANARGIAELRRLCRDQGAVRTSAYVQHVQDNAAAAVRRALGTLRNGDCRVPLDAGMEIRVRVEVDARAGRARIDFTGTSVQDFPRPHNFHAPLAVTTAAVLYVFRTLVGRGR